MTTDLDKQVAVIDGMLEFFDGGKRWMTGDLAKDTDGCMVFDMPRPDHATETVAGCCLLGAAAVAYRRVFPEKVEPYADEDGWVDIDNTVGHIAEDDEPFLMAIYDAITEDVPRSKNAVTVKIANYNDDSEGYYDRIERVLIDAKARLLAQNA